MILTKLKEATKMPHQRTETSVNVMDQMLDVRDYEILLRKFYGFYAAVEPEISAFFNSYGERVGQI